MVVNRQQWNREVTKYHKVNTINTARYQKLMLKLYEYEIKKSWRLQKMQQWCGKDEW